MCNLLKSIVLQYNITSAICYINNMTQIICTLFYLLYHHPLFPLFFFYLLMLSLHIVWIGSAIGQYSGSWMYSTVTISVTLGLVPAPSLPPPILSLLLWPFLICMDAVVGAFCWPKTSFFSHRIYYTLWGHVLKVVVGHIICCLYGACLYEHQKD